MIDDLFDGVSETVIRKEKAKAREMRKSSWWKNKIGKGICYYCGREKNASELTMDHIVPLARGGRSTKGNLVPACKDCNNRKKTMLPVEWDEYMAQLEKPDHSSSKSCT